MLKNLVVGNQIKDDLVLYDMIMNSKNKQNSNWMKYYKDYIQIIVMDI